MEHEYLANTPFVIKMDNNSLTYVLMTPNLDATGHRWVGALASYEFKLEYQKGSDNGTADTLSQVPICHDQSTVKSLVEGVAIGASTRYEAEASSDLLEEHLCLVKAKLTPMHMVDWVESQDADSVLTTCRKWLKTHKDTPPPQRDASLRKLVEGHMDEGNEGCILFCVHNSLVQKRGPAIFEYHSQGRNGECPCLCCANRPTSGCLEWHPCWTLGSAEDSQPHPGMILVVTHGHRTARPW